MTKLIFIFLLPVLLSAQTTYYIKAAGDNTKSGTSIANAWKTPNAVNGHTRFVAGDSILFNRGDTFNGQINKVFVGTQANPIVIGTYGSGAKPIFYGDGRELTWTAIPNRTGYYRSVIADSADFSNYVLQYYGGAWVTSSAQQLRGNDPPTWYGSFLDSLGEGEYAVDASLDTLFYHTLGSVTFPATRDSIRVYREWNRIITGSAWYIIRDLELRSFELGLLLNGRNGIARGLKVVNSYSAGIRQQMTEQVLVDSSTVDSVRVACFYPVQAHKSQIRYCTGSNVLVSPALLDGMPTLSESDFAGVAILGNYGYGGIMHAADTLGFNTIEYNTFDHTRYGFDYFYNFGDTVRYNTGHGLTGAGSPLGSGLVFSNNTLSMSATAAGGSGITIAALSGGSITVENNVLDSVYAPSGIFVTSSPGTFTTIKYNSIRVVAHGGYTDFRANIGTLDVDSNSYYGVDGRFSYGIFPSQVLYYTIAAWFAASGLDEHSTLNQATLSLTSGNNQSRVVSGALALPCVVTLRDTSGNLVVGSTVTFAIASVPGGATGQSLSALTPTTDANGQASSTLTLGNLIGTYTVTATNGSYSGSPVTFTATGAPASASTIALSSGNNQSTTLLTTIGNSLVAVVRDANTNPVSGTSVTFAIVSVPANSSGHSLITTSTTTDANGLASTNLTVGQHAGTLTVTATSAGLSGSPVTFTATATRNRTVILR